MSVLEEVGMALSGSADPFHRSLFIFLIGVSVETSAMYQWGQIIAFVLPTVWCSETLS